MEGPDADRATLIDSWRRAPDHRAGRSRERDAEVIGDTEKRMLAVLLEFTQRGEQIEGLQQITDAIGLSAKSRTSVILNNLEKEGFVKFDRTIGGRMKPETIRLSNVEQACPVPVLGQVAAGKPLLSNIDGDTEFIPLPARYVRGPQIYMLKVRGDSMTGDGILDGDLVIVDHGEEPRDGEIAVIRIGEEDAVIKHIWREDGSIRLVSSNPAFGPQIYYESDLPIVQGKVIGLVRWPT
jgi:repressor LexA